MSSRHWIQMECKRQDVGQGKYATRIIQLIKENNKITKADIAKELNVSEKTVEREMKKIPNVKYVGSGYSGHWEIKAEE